MFDRARMLKRAAVRRLRHSTLLASLWRRMMWRTTVIAITGSVGKTTCRELLSQVLSDQGQTYRTPNNQNDAYSVPRVLLGLRPWHRFAVIELAASGPGTLGPLAKMVAPDIALITRVARTHTRNYPGIDAIAHEKAELLRYLKPTGTAVLNGDDERIAAMYTRPSQRRVEFGCAVERQVKGLDITAIWPERLRMTVRTDRAVQAIQTQLVGEHWSSAVLAAFAAAEQCGVDAASIADSMAKVKPFRGRMQPIALPNGAVAISDQNASQDVFEAMVAVANSARADRKLVVLGNLNDAHPNGSSARRKLAARIIAKTFDIAIFFGMSGSKACKAAIAAGMQPDSVFSADTLSEVDALLKAQLRKGDLLFVKGRNLLHLNRTIYLQFGTIGCMEPSCDIRSDCEICSQLQPGFDLALTSTVS